MLFARLRGWLAGAPRGARLEEAIRLYEAGDADAAAAACRELLEREPELPTALHLLGLARLARGAAAEAEALIRRAVARDPQRALYRFNLGNSLLALGAREAAADAFEHALALQPSDAAALFNLGAVRLDMGDADAAVDAFARLCGLRPEMPAAWAQLATALYRRAERARREADYGACIDAARTALALPGLAPADADELRKLHGHALLAREKVSEALAVFTDLRPRRPEDADVCVGYANCLTKLGRAQEAFDALRRCCELHPGHLALASGAIMASDYVETIGPEENAELRFRLATACAGPRAARRFAPERTPDRMLRIGYLSSDLYYHVAMSLFSGVLRAHDAAAFEIHVYNASPIRDATTARLQALAPRWQDVHGMPAGDIAARIATDGIDILVELSGHTANNRLDVLALHSAPLQASWLGYPGSTGLPQVDYLISDPYTSPPASDRYCSERVWRLPATRFCYEPPDPSPAPALPPADAPPTFGCFNNLSKLNPGVLRLWRLALDAVPDAKLVLKSATLDIPQARNWLARELGRAGIDAARVELSGRSPHAETLAQYTGIHLALDPFPYCGGLTSLDA
ncbi:MAG TPA: tetratricopeptide repeat protein, partial [Burkholderiales bacterium]|nr:tetratricopeptide repeat protein [Burkholderiales bacterium]